MNDKSCIIRPDVNNASARSVEASTIQFNAKSMTYAVRWPDGSESTVAAERVVPNRREYR